ncbi:MAG: hypothetical protein U9Q82_01440, partial [Chloroflexota bacterium]|nr:hypothetical protein [Chloroflexota bacterium]
MLIRRIIILITSILALAACTPAATPQVDTVQDEEAATLTITPTETTLPTETLTPTATPIPPTPEHESVVRYDPEARTLNNLQGTPVFQLEAGDKWKQILPAAVEPMVEQMVGVFEGGVEIEQMSGGYEGEEAWRVTSELGAEVIVTESGRKLVESVGGDVFEINSVGEFEGEVRAYYPGQQEGGERWWVFNKETGGLEEVAFSGFNEKLQARMMGEYLVGQGVLDVVDESRLGEEGYREM